MVSEVDDEWVHALMTHDGDPRWVHDDDGDLHDSCDGRFRRDERYVPDERNGVGICGACRGADGEVGCGETCLYVRPIFVWMEFVVSMSRKVEPEVQILSGGLDLGLGSVHVGHGGDQDLGW